ncbi:MAG: YhbY family RNA-binding protein [Oscillospiraceae bacterium]|nr:YhbY family RNA-binding protein [Oscillospiraceae bacterium]
MSSNITSKQRAALRGIANSYDTIFQIGKSSEISENLVKQVNDALAARELIKLRVLNNSEYSAKDAAVELSEKTNSEIVQVIGTRFVLFKQNPDPDKRKISI